MYERGYESVFFKGITTGSDGNSWVGFGFGKGKGNGANSASCGEVLAPVWGMLLVLLLGGTF